MEKGVVTILIFLTACSSNFLNAQRWKQYADSAKAFSNQKNTNKAIELYSKVIEELKKDSVGTNSYAVICDSLAMLFIRKQQYEKSEPLFLEAKQIKETLNGKNNLDYANSCHYLGFVYYSKAQYQKAETFYLQAIQIRESILGKNNPDYVKSSYNLAVLYYYTRQYEKAEPLYLEVKQTREKLFGKDHPDYAACCNSLAILYSVRGQYEKAEPLFLEAKQIVGKLFGSEHLNYAASCNDLAVFYENMGHYRKAEPLALEAKQILEKVSGKEHPVYATSCNTLAILYIKMGQHEKAEPLCLEAKKIREKVLGKEHLDYASTCNTLATLYSDMGLYEKAEPLYLEAKQIREKVFGKNHREYAGSCNNLAIVYWRMGQYEKAEPLYLEAKQIRERVLGKEDPEYATSCSNVAVLYYDMGQYEKAEPLYLEAKQIREKTLGKEHPEYAALCDNLANLYRHIGQYEKAEPLYLQAKKIREQVLGKEHPEYANACNNLAGLYSHTGQYEKAEQLYLEAKQIRGKALGKEHTEYAAACINLANLYRQIGQHEQAELLYLEAKQIQQKVLGKEHPDYAACCHNLAILYRRMGQYEKAEQLYLEAKQIQQKVLGKEHADYAASCSNLADLYSYMGQYEKAEQLYLEAKQIREKVLGKQHPNYAASFNNLAVFYIATGQYEKAKPLCLEAKQIQGKVLGKLHPDYGSSCLSLARLYWILHQPLKAEKEFKESFSINSNNVFSIFQFTNEKEKTAFIKNISGGDDIAYSFYVSTKIKSEQPYSLSLFHRNRILSASQALKKQLFSANDTSLINKYTEWINLKKYLSVLYSKPVDRRKEDAVKIEEKAGELEKELARLSSTFKKQQQKVDWKDIKNKLQADEASIEFASFQFNNSRQGTDTVWYVALVLRKNMRWPAMIILCNEKQLTTLLSSTGNRTNNDGGKQLYNSRGVIVDRDSTLVIDKSIYELIWKPLEKKLKGINTIYFAPAGMLHRIAFAAMPVNKKEVLSDKYKLVQLATTASVADQQSSFVTTADKIQLYGCISYSVDSTELKDAVLSYNNVKAINHSLPADLIRGEVWNDLPGTKSEIEGIASLSNKYKASITSLSGIHASEESLKALDGSSSPAVLHIATHGFFFPDPKQDEAYSSQKSFDSGRAFKLSDDPLMRSGLLFTGANVAWKGEAVEGIEDGILTSYEVSNMYLPNTKLVVLSACETGLGDIQGSEGVYGLQRAFKLAGVQNLVMSLWKVPDAETAEFMQMLYKSLFDGKSISDAFYEAQTIMKNKFRNEPHKWAAWVLVK